MDLLNLGKANEALANGDLKYTIVTGTEFLNDNSQDELGALSRSVDGIITQTKSSVAAFEKGRATMLSLVDEMRNLTDAAANGNINERGNVKKFEGDFSEMVGGMNALLDAVSVRVQAVAERVEKLRSLCVTNLGKAAEVSQNLVEINAQIEKVSVVMTEISAASEQQNQGVEQINVSVEQMNSVTQQTAANSEESAAAAEELSGQSQEMLSLISSFRLSGGQGHGVKPRSNGGMIKNTPAHRQPQPTVAAAKNGGGWKSKTTNGNGFHSDSNDLIPFDDGDSVLREF